MSNHQSDHFRTFAKSLERLLVKYGKVTDEERLAIQRAQIEELYSLEKEFRKVLIAHRWGESTYKAFVRHICDSNKNILTARPYFRARQEVCIGPISAILERRDHKALYKYDFNYQFVAFVVNAYKWHPLSPIRVLAKKIEKARDEIIHFNLPLMLSQARIFWSKAPAKSAFTHITHMDLVQISCDGLISACDKFVLPTDATCKSEKELNEAFRKFRPMAIQRAVGNFIEGFSETMVHFFPKYKRKIYHAHKYLVRQDGNIDYEKVAAAINVDDKGAPVEASLRTTAAEIGSLLLAASSSMATSETSTSETDEERENPLDRCSADEKSRPDIQTENEEAIYKLTNAISMLPGLDQKILRLKGLAISDE